MIFMFLPAWSRYQPREPSCSVTASMSFLNASAALPDQSFISVSIAVWWSCDHCSSFFFSAVSASLAAAMPIGSPIRMSSGHRRIVMCSMSQPIPAVSRLPIGSSTRPMVSSAMPAEPMPIATLSLSLTALSRPTAASKNPAPADALSLLKSSPPWRLTSLLL